MISDHLSPFIEVWLVDFEFNVTPGNMMAHPFQPMTTEQLKKLTRVNQDSDQTINSEELSAVFDTQEPKSILELNPQHSENNQFNIRTDNRY